MDIKKVTGVYFSPAGSTKTVVETTVDELARLFKAECRYISLNTPSDRAQEYQFAPDELVVFGCPVYAGRLPNKISPDFARCLHGEGTPAVALVTYGGRAYDNALAEMCELLTKNNFKPAAGGAFLCRHVFSDKLAAGRPDAADLSELRMLAQGAALKLRSEGEIKPPKVPGDAQAAYYTPLKTDKTPAKFLKAKPSTAAVLCEKCGLCAKLCPMGAIDPENPTEIPGNKIEKRKIPATGGDFVNCQKDMCVCRHLTIRGCRYKTTNNSCRLCNCRWSRARHQRRHYNKPNYNNH